MKCQILKQKSYSNKILCSKYVWNHGIVSQDEELSLFPFSVDAKDACQNDQFVIDANEITSDDEDLNFDTILL